MRDQGQQQRFEDVAHRRIRDIMPEVDLEASGVIFNLVRAANRVVQDLEATIHRPLGLSWAGFRILFSVLTMGPCEAQQLARLAGVTRASISSVLDTLERRALVERRRESADKRVVTVVLTERGQATVREAIRRQNVRERAWVTGMDHAERNTLADLLRRLAQHHPGTPQS